MHEVWLQTVKVTYFNCCVDGYVIQSVRIHLLFWRFIYLHAAFSLLLSAVESVIGDESFKLKSSIASKVLKVGQQLHQWLKAPTNAALAVEFTILLSRWEEAESLALLELVVNLFLTILLR